MPVVPIGDFGRINNGNIPNPTFAITAMMGVLDSAITFTRASAATYYNSSGIITSAGNNVARFDYNPTTLALNGLLIEQNSTNLIKSSGAIGDANWTNQAQTVTLNNAVAPDGTTTASLLTTTIATFPDSQQSVGSSTSGSYPVEFFVKQTTNASVWVSLSDNTANSAGVLFTFVGATFINGTVGNGSVTSAVSQVLPNGWIKLSCVFAFSGAGAANFVLTIGPWNDTAGNATIGNTVLVWGGDPEKGANRTQSFSGVLSYIPTTAASASRSSDNAQITSIPWFNPNAGTFLVTSIYNQFNTAPVVFGPTGGGGFNDQGNGKSQWFNGSSNVATSNAKALNTVAKEAFAYTASSRAICLNAGTVATDGNVPWGSTPTAFSLGSNGGGSNQFMNGWIQSLKYWNYTLTNVQLQQITT